MSNVVYFDGKFVAEEKALISVKTHALHYGTGCFEGIRAYYNKKEDTLFIFRLEDHYKRFKQSGKILFISQEETVQQLCDVTIELIKRNFVKQDIYIRPLAFKSDPAVGNFNLHTLKNSLVIYTVPLGRHLNTDEGIRANTSSWTRTADNAIPARGKVTGAYINTSLAKTESTLSGFDEAILLDHNGHVVEGSAENLFLIKDGVILTPPASDDILVGITRDTVIKICKDELGLEVLERSIDRTEMYQADELILVGTGAEIAPVIEVDHRSIGEGKPGPIGKKIKDTYFKLVHGDYDKYPEFLTKIKL